MDYPLDKSCVTIEPLDPLPCDDCGDDTDGFGESVGRDATRMVMLDLRGNGMKICVGVYCDECAEEVASRLRDSLPDEQPDDSIERTVLEADAETAQAILDTPGHAFDPAIHVVSESEAYRIPEDTKTVPDIRETLLAQSLKELFVEYVGNDMSQWPERQEEFRHVAAQAVRGELWKLDDWKCKRCGTMNLESAQSCRKCGKERGERVILHTNTVPGSLMERVIEARSKGAGIWSELWKAEPGEVDSPGREPAKRDVFAVIDRITALVPLHEFNLLADLARLRKTAQYKSPEAMGDVWYRGSELLSETFPDPDALSDWQRSVVDIWMDKEQG